MSGEKLRNLMEGPEKIAIGAGGLMLIASIAFPGVYFAAADMIMIGGTNLGIGRGVFPRKSQ